MATTLFAQARTCYKALMRSERSVSPSLLVAGTASLCLLLTGIGMPPVLHAGTNPVEVQFRGCEVAGWCRFSTAASEPPFRVQPDGVVRARDDDAVAVAVRNRLNALLASMIHQHKKIVLLDLRELADGAFAATVIVNDANVAADPILVELNEKAGAKPR